MTIFENTPFRRDKNLVEAYNSFMRLLPDDDSWALFKDADTLFLMPFYGNIVEDCINENPEISCFTAITNRIYPRVMKDDRYKGDDIRIHREVAKDIYEEFGNTVIEYPKGSMMSGVCFALKKSAWKDIGGFKPYHGQSNILGVDNQLHIDLSNKGHRVGIMKGLYLYHWYRGGDSSDVSHLE